MGLSEKEAGGSEAGAEFTEEGGREKRQGMEAQKGV